MTNPVLSMLGLAAKSRNLVSGEFSVEKAIKNGSAYLVVIAEDASDNTKKKFHDSCEFYECPILDFGTKESLGRAIGKELRASIAICDEDFSKAILDKADLGTR